jgi:hypothetical protein
MTLTQQQIAAAKARGCVFFPATDEQVARLGMQRRIFTLDGKPYVASRDGGGFLETHGTLAALVDPASDSKPEPAESVDEAVAADAETAAEMAAEGGGRGAQVVRRGGAGARPRPRPPWRASGAARDRNGSKT